MLETFKARLKAKSTAAGANLSDVRIDAIADRLNTKNPDLTEEADHDEKIDDLFDEATLKELGALDDHQRAKAKREADKKKADAAKKKKPVAKKKKEDDDEADDDLEDDDDNDTPKWAKSLLKQNKTLSERLENFEKEKTQGTLKQKIAEKLKDVPEDFYDEWQLPDSEDGVEEFTKKVTEKFASFKTKAAEKGFALIDKPQNGGAGGTKDKVTPKEIDAVLDNIKI